MANITEYLKRIKEAVYGKDVRSSIHDGMSAINDELESTTSEQQQLSNAFECLIINAGNSNAEVVVMRTDANGHTFNTAGERLNNMDSKIEEVNSTTTRTIASMQTDVAEDIGEIRRQIEEKANYQEVDDKITKAQLEAGNIDTTNLVVKSELDNSIRTGKLYLNLGVWEDGFIDSTGVPTTSDVWKVFRRTSNFYIINKNVTYTFKATNNANCIVRKYDSGGNYIGSVNTSGVLNVKFTDCDLIKVAINNADGSAAQQSEKNIEITSSYEGVFALEEDYKDLLQNNSSLLKDYFQAIPTGANQITLDTNNKTIYFPRCYVYSNGKLHVTTSEKTLSYSGFSDFVWIYVNTETKNVELTSNYVNESNMLFLGLFPSQQYMVRLSHVHFNAKILGDLNSDDYNGKSFAVLGDSISTFTGISENSKNGNEYRTEYYPNIAAKVTTYSDMWWGILQDKLGMKRTGVSAISQSCYRSQNDNTRLEGYADARINRLSTGGTPDYIFLALGTNDGYNTFNLEYDGEIDKNTLLTNSTKTAPACALTILKLQEAYPNAKIVVIIPKFCNITKLDYTSSNFMKTCNGIEFTSDALGVYKVIDLRKCGINYSNVDENTIDGIHPNKLGMIKMGNYIIEELTK